MYTDEDLTTAVARGIFRTDQVELFRRELAGMKNHSPVDEENFRLITGFNDIFVVIACVLMLLSAAWVFRPLLGEAGGALLVVILSWTLTEFFVRKRKMALPAIVLLLSYIGAAFYFVPVCFPESFELRWVFAAAVAALCAWVHWLRFRVPITVAAGVAACAAFVVALILIALPDAKNWAATLMLVAGVLVFILAMLWDSSDRERLTRRSDVAFWLHMLAAPLIVHAVFVSLGVMDGEADVVTTLIVILLYLVLTGVSVVIDRRAFMVSSLVYVLVALSRLLEIYGAVNYNFALTGGVIGALLLLLSAFWHPVRASVVRLFPARIQQYVPVLKPPQV